MEENNTFRYTYSAKQQEEIKNIRKKYAAPEENKMEQIIKLDRKVSQKAQSCSIAFGVIGALVLGTGMSLTMTELSGLLGGAAMFAGIVIGVTGIILVAMAYPVYNYILKKERQKIAPEIIRLTDELLK